ncbi:MAG TPA: thiopurine S-methyltransferase [Gallionella sp.]
MEKDFWLERWNKSEIGFHQGEVNPYLRRYWPELNLARGSEVFVPLCGKSRDLLWLREQEHRVIGVELSDLAVRAFFEENGYAPKLDSDERFECQAADDIRLLCGDLFDLAENDLAEVTAVYDRAALVALSADMRERYVRHLASILPPATQTLLITFDYRQDEMPGPPFAVSPEEVHRLYHDYAEINLLAQLDVLAQNPHFQARGLTGLQENIFLLTLR